MNCWQVLIDHRFVAFFGGLDDLCSFLRFLGPADCVHIQRVNVGEVKPLCKEGFTV